MAIPLRYTLEQATGLGLSGIRVDEAINNPLGRRPVTTLDVMRESYFGLDLSSHADETAIYELSPRGGKVYWNSLRKYTIGEVSDAFTIPEAMLRDPSEAPRTVKLSPISWDVYYNGERLSGYESFERMIRDQLRKAREKDNTYSSTAWTGRPENPAPRTTMTRAEAIEELEAFFFAIPKAAVEYLSTFFVDEIYVESGKIVRQPRLLLVPGRRRRERKKRGIEFKNNMRGLAYAFGQAAETMREVGRAMGVTLKHALERIHKSRLKREYMEISRALDDLHAERALLLSPTDDEYHSLYEKLDRVQDELEVNDYIVGNCEICSKPLFDGDEGYAYLDYDPIVCAAHAPTYGESLEAMYSVEEEERDDFFGGEPGIWEKNRARYEAEDPKNRITWKL